jgi:hypothetical protein
MDQFVILSFSMKPDGEAFLGARFGGVSIGVLFETCGEYTASLVCIGFSVIPDMKSRNDLWELVLFFEKVT